MPPAAPATNSPGQGDCPRQAVLAGQLVADTATQTVVHPLQTGYTVGYNTAAALGRLGKEMVCKRLLLPLCDNPEPIAPERPRLDPDCLEVGLRKASKTKLKPALLHLLLDGEEALTALEGLIDQAEQSIDVLVYEFESDALGWQLAEELAGRAACLGRDVPGPVVRVLVDGGANLIHAPKQRKTAREVNAVLAWLIRQPHVEVLRTRNGFAHFDHRKLVVVDGCVALTGGRNFTVESFFTFRDVTCTVRGPLVADLAERFEKTWHEAGGAPRPVAAGCKPADSESAPLLPSPPRGEGRRGAATECAANARARIVGTGRCERTLAASLYRAVDQACHHVYLENPYFTDTQLWCKLARARKRGADIRVVLAQDSDNKVIDKALRVGINRLLKAGVRVYRYPGTTHAKAASVDSLWAYFGTGNFDSLSLRRNNEVGLAVAAGPIIAELEEKLFQEDFRPEWEVTAPLPVGLDDYLCELVATLML
jgi:cardiolipin synthase